MVSGTLLWRSCPYLSQKKVSPEAGEPRCNGWFNSDPGFPDPARLSFLISVMCTAAVAGGRVAWLFCRGQRGRPAFVPARSPARTRRRSPGGLNSEQLSVDQLRLFVQEFNAPESGAATETHQDDDVPPGSTSNGSEDQDESRRRGRRTLPAHLKRERIEHDLAEEEKHCAACSQDLRPIGEETSERYEYIRRSCW
jgi:hypothetical protein